MKPPTLILRPNAMATAAPAVLASGKQRLELTPLGPGRGPFHIRTQSVLDYLVGTLLKTW